MSKGRWKVGDIIYHAIYPHHQYRIKEYKENHYIGELIASDFLHHKHRIGTKDRMSIGAAEGSYEKMFTNYNKYWAKLNE